MQRDLVRCYRGRIENSLISSILQRLPQKWYHGVHFMIADPLGVSSGLLYGISFNRGSQLICICQKFFCSTELQVVQEHLRINDLLKQAYLGSAPGNICPKNDPVSKKNAAQSQIFQISPWNQCHCIHNPPIIKRATLHLASTLLFKLAYLAVIYFSRWPSRSVYHLRNT